MTDKEYFEDFNKHLMEDQKPSAYFKELEASGTFRNNYPLTMLADLKKTEQNPTHHPEGNVWNHTLLVVDNAALFREQSENSRVFMWSALLHDIGKPSTTKMRKGKITAYDHDKAGEGLSREFLEFFTQEQELIYQVSKMVRWHMQVLMVIKDLPFANIKAMVKEVPINEIALLAMCDRLGRGEITEEALQDEKKHTRQFLEKCMPYVR